MKHKKDCALEVKEVNGQLEMYVHTDLTLFLDHKPLSELQGTKILNPIDGLKFFKDTNDNYAYIDRNDVEIMWCNAKGETGKEFADVALQDNGGEYDAWFIGKIVTKRISGISHSEIGSAHWFNTIVSQHLHVGEFMKEHSLKMECGQIKSLGNRVYESSKELLNWAKESKLLTND